MRGNDGLEGYNKFLARFAPHPNPLPGGEREREHERIKYPRQSQTLRAYRD
ncbi:hypothetical protein GCM10007901_03390 [Dyella acidisoli]|uniref:Transposase n=1 Tax=Dyella acidisoli TaxID=1867834 RepID=A0ABQ5XJM1_9GAMM|nr:hypothetical protein GCM10007901_03390 [Dyella acidisoli]